MGKKKWQYFSEQELKEIILNSKTYKEALEKIGYNSKNTENNKIIREIADKYNIPLDHFSNGSYIDLTGKVFGRLTVLERVENKNKGRARWKCLCSCGTIKEVDGTHLRRGEIVSCGCFKNEQTTKRNIEGIEDLTGKQFGKLTVIKRAENIGLQPAWYCQCDCGTYTKPIMASNLRRGQTQSCGCLVSKGEFKIRQILNENKIRFKTQVSFEDCKFIDKLKFDFGIYDENDVLLYLIEFNGRQHYEETNFFSDSLIERQEKDKIKEEYCKNKKIPLLIIPFTEIDNLTIEKLLI